MYNLYMSDLKFLFLFAKPKANLLSMKSSFY